MSYKDSQMVIASQIAYMDFSSEAVNAGTFTVKELLEIELQSASGQQKERVEKLLDLIQESPGGEECGNWIIRDIRNDQHTSGMYACMIDTGDGDALVAFRGSESDTLENIAKDWVMSDFGLLNSVLTPQQVTAQRYMEDIYEKYGEKYGGFGVTGHSLGGNLAEHATVTAPDGMRDKITQCVNLDGPGFSANYQIAHAGDIAKSEGLIRHYQWSAVGTLLMPLPGTKYQTIGADTPDNENVLASLIWRHDTGNVQFDEEGNVIPGNRDALAVAAGPLSQILDMSIFAMAGFLVIPPMLFNIIDTVRDQLRNWWEAWQDYRNSGMRAEFAVSTRAVRGNLQDMEAISGDIFQIAEEVEQIKNTLAMDSMAAGYIKMKLWSLAGSIGRDAEKLRDYCEKGSECMQRYEISEQKIVENYR